MELWDGYDQDGGLTGIDLIRGEPIPRGLYHLVSDILVRHTDGDYLLMRRDCSKPNFGGWEEATAGGSALKGESSLTCAIRELREETGIQAATLEEFGRYRSHNTIYVQYLCVTEVTKDAVKLQEGETVSYRWVSEAEFIAFVNSGSMIPTQRERYGEFLKKMGYQSEKG